MKFLRRQKIFDEQDWWKDALGTGGRKRKKMVKEKKKWGKIWAIISTCLFAGNEWPKEFLWYRQMTILTLFLLDVRYHPSFCSGKLTSVGLAFLQCSALLRLGLVLFNDQWAILQLTKYRFPEPYIFSSIYFLWLWWKVIWHDIGFDFAQRVALVLR